MTKEKKSFVVSTPGLSSGAARLASQASGRVCSIIVSIVAAEISVIVVARSRFRNKV
jgi:hypothetical protein